MEEKVVCIFPHSDDEFADIDELQGWLINKLTTGEEPGRYLLRKIGLKDKNFISMVIPGSLILFRKGEYIVGEGIAKTGINRLDQPIDKKYYNEIYVMPESIQIYELPLNDVKAWCNRTQFPTNLINEKVKTGRFYLIIGRRASFEQEFLDRFPSNENTKIINRSYPEDDGGWSTGEDIAKGFPPNVNSIPGVDSNTCYRTLMVAIGSLDNIEARILEAAYHVNVFCLGKNMEVIFEAAKWESEIWRKHARKFDNLKVILRIKGANNETIL